MLNIYKKYCNIACTLKLITFNTGLKMAKLLLCSLYIAAFCWLFLPSFFLQTVYYKIPIKTAHTTYYKYKQCIDYLALIWNKIKVYNNFVWIYFCRNFLFQSVSNCNSYYPLNVKKNMRDLFMPFGLVQKKGHL